MHHRTLQRFERLFDQQLWCLGRDVLRPGDNLLAARGFERTPAPPGAATSSLWRLRTEGSEVELSSLGVRLTRGATTLFVSRNTTLRQVREADPALVAGLCAWFAAYEDWVRSRCGDGWRAQTLSERTRRAAVPAAAMRDAWRELERQARQDGSPPQQLLPGRQAEGDPQRGAAQHVRHEVHAEPHP
ncbi:MAG: hypothetical protein JNJ54_29125 [Myxococcaceae bacterium]|nr:hypothetical protein [Myxococcaceae bacterium]